MESSSVHTEYLMFPLTPVVTVPDFLGALTIHWLLTIDDIPP